MIYFLDPYKVLSHALVEPRVEFLVRPLNAAFVERLKCEMIQRPSTFAKPLIAIVKNVQLKMDGYTLEVIGGNLTYVYYMVELNLRCAYYTT